MVRITIDITSKSHSYETHGPLTSVEALRLYYALDFMKADVVKAINEASTTINITKGGKDVLDNNADG